MKKSISYILSAAFVLSVASCSNGAKDDKNKVEHYPTTDTTQAMENKNDENNTNRDNNTTTTYNEGQR